MNQVNYVLINTIFTLISKFVEYVDLIHNPTYNYLSLYFIGLLLAVYMSEGLSTNYKWTCVSLSLLFLNMATYAPAIHNTFRALPQKYVPHYFIIVKVLWALGIGLGMLAVHSWSKSTSRPTKTIDRSRLNEHSNSKPLVTMVSVDTLSFTHFFKAVTRLSGSLYLINYWYIRWDFFSNRSLLDTSLMTFLKRFAYIVPFSLIVAYVFHIVFIVPLDKWRCRLLGKNMRSKVISKVKVDITMSDNERRQSKLKGA